MRFLVIDLQTGEYPDLERIAETEEWAKGLDPSEMKGFHIEEDDVLCLTDNHGGGFCPEMDQRRKSK